MVDQLANEYASQPVVFLEQNYYYPIGQREDRFWSAHGGGYAGFPMIIVDSGHQVTDRLASGTDFYTIYKGMVNSELARAPQADVSATYTREGDHFQVEVWV